MVLGAGVPFQDPAAREGPTAGAMLALPVLWRQDARGSMSGHLPVGGPVRGRGGGLGRFDGDAHVALFLVTALPHKTHRRHLGRVDKLVDLETPIAQLAADEMAVLPVVDPVDVLRVQRLGIDLRCLAGG